MNNDAPQQTIPSTLRQDCALVTHFMAYNGGYVLKYEKAQQILKDVGYILAKSTNMSARTEAAGQGADAADTMKDCKSKMIHIPASPEEWAVQDLQKLKTDPKGREVFAALARVRDAIYDPNVDADLRKELASTLLDRISGRRIDALKALLERVHIVGEGDLSQK